MDESRVPSEIIGDPFKAARPEPPIFQTASTVLKNNSGSLRNVSTGDDLEGASSNNGEASSTSTSQTADGPAPTSSGEQPAPAGPVKPVHRSASSKNAIVYSAVQRRNPVLHAIKNVPTEIGDIPADYQVGTHNGVLFLSLKYHRLHPEYIHQRIEKMKKIYNLRILMILCDVSEHQQSLRELTKIAIINELSTFVAWSNDEIAQYLTTFKQYEHKSADTLKERVHQVYSDQLQHVLTSGKKVNKTDAHNLASQFGSFAEISRQGPKALAGVKGLGPTKVNSLVDAFTKPFVVGGLKRKKTGSSTSDQVNGGNEAAIAEVGVVNGTKNIHKGKGKAKAVDGAGGSDENAERDTETSSNSPIEEDDDDDDGPVDWPISPGRERVPSQSRSPGLSPEPRHGVGDIAEETAWKDPLEDDDEEQGQGGEIRDGKRQRTA